MSGINDILAKLNPKVAETFRLASDTRNDLQRTPSLGINRAIGGIGYGRQTTIWGNRSGGKTAFCLQLAGIAQAEGKGVAWIDAEKNFDKAWASRLGVNPDEMAVSRITSISDMADAGHDLLRAGVDILVVDSISALLPNSYLDEGELKAFDSTGQIGTYSKNMGAACNMLNRVNDHTAVILVSQVRNAIGSYGASITPMGGKGVEHMNSTSLKFWSSMADKEQIYGNLTEGDYIFKRPIGRPVNWTVDKNRGPGMGHGDKYDFYYDGETVGVDYVGEILDFGIEAGKIKKGGAWITIYGEQIQGRAKAAKYLRENPEIVEKLEGELL